MNPSLELDTIEIEYEGVTFVLDDESEFFLSEGPELEAQRKKRKKKKKKNKLLIPKHKAPMVRLEYMSLTQGQRNQFNDRMNAAYSSGLLDQLSTWHGNHMSSIHGVPMFGPGHRYALFVLEKYLGVPIPYLAWERGVSASVFTDYGLGPDGNPNIGNRAVTGPFAHHRPLIYNAATGGFQKQSETGIVRRIEGSGVNLPTTADFQQLLGIPSFAEFIRSLEMWHNYFHNWMRGQMGTIFSTGDPAFWVHHASIDRWWSIWQKQRGIMLYSGPLGQRIPGYNRVSVKGVMDLRKMNIVYR